MKITNVVARQILDSRGNPTVEADVYLDDSSFGRAAVPSGASTGSREALELRDGNENEYEGKGVTKAIANITKVIKPAIINIEFEGITELDEKLRELDGTKDKSNLGANAVLAVSLAAAKALADQKGIHFWQLVAELAGNSKPSLPRPMMNILNGGQHASESTDIQEFMIIPMQDNIASCIRSGSEIFHSLKKVLKGKGFATTVGDEGGFAPSVKDGEEALDLINQAVTNTSYSFGNDVKIALDVAATEIYKNGVYDFEHENKKLTAKELISWYAELISKYPIVSIEDGLAEDDWDNWVELTKEIGDNVALVGDDLLVTNTETLKEAIKLKAANAILLKPNQIGTLTETIEAHNTAREAGWKTVVSHRSGETEDTSISHIAVGVGSDYIKTGSLSRTDRVAKYNELIRIAETDDNLEMKQ
jgi:enolase